MEALRVFPHDLTPAQTPDALQTMGLGQLFRAKDPRVKRVINGDWCLTLSYPADAPEANLLQADNLICAEGQMFRILRPNLKDTKSGRVIEVEAPHLFYDLRDYSIVNIETKEDENYIDGITAQQALEQVLAGTPFAVGTVDVDLTVLDYLEVLQLKVFDVIKDQVLKNWGGELQPDNWTVNLRAALGTDRKFPIRHRRNIKGITCNTDIEPVVTRLHVRGYENANFEEINDGKDYIDSPNIGAYSHIKEDYVDFSDDDDPQVLMEKGQEHLATVDIPKVSYEVDLLELRNSMQYALYKPLERLDIGDTAVVHHPNVAVDVLLRCTELERNPETGDNVSVTLGNPDDKMLAALSSSAATADTVARVVDANGFLRAEKLAGPIDIVRANTLVASIIQAVSVAFDDATIGTALINKLQAFTADFISTAIDWAEVENLSAAMLTVVQQAVINWAKIEGIDAGSVLFRMGEGGKLYVDDLAVAEGNMVNLTVGTLMLRGADGKFYRLEPDVTNGGVKLTEAVVDEGNIANNSIPGGKLVEGSVTAKEINVTLLMADQTMSRAIKAANLDVDEILASDAFIGKITTDHLASSVGKNLNLETNEALVARVKKDDLEAWARYDGVNLELATAGSPFVARLGTSALTFLVSGVPRASFGADRMYIDRAEIGLLTVGRDATYAQAEKRGFVDIQVKDGGLVGTWRSA